MASECNVIHELITNEPCHFISVFDDARLLIEDRWIYNYSLVHGRSDEEIAARFSYLSFQVPAMCRVLVPAGAKIGFIGDNQTKIIDAYKLYGRTGVDFWDKKVLPLPPYRQLDLPKKPRWAYDVFVDSPKKFCRVYDKKIATQMTPWMYPLDMVEGKTSEELKQSFFLPYCPKYRCDVETKDVGRMEAWQLPNQKIPMAFRYEGYVCATHERVILQLATS